MFMYMVLTLVILGFLANSETSEGWCVTGLSPQISLNLMDYKVLIPVLISTEISSAWEDRNTSEVS